MTWDPQQYMLFKNYRLRPAVDLVGAIPLEKPKSVVDLGCGPGNVTKILKERWPDADVVGIDSSREMLAEARAKVPKGIRWQQKDVARWKPRARVDVIYSNATLHWLGDHETLFPRLMKQLKPGGILAVQMPRNFEAPSHTVMYDVARSGPWKDKLAPVLRPTPVMSSAKYYEILAPHSSRLNIWETEYLQVLEGADPVAEWTKGTWLKPLLDALEEPMKSQFEAEYKRRLRKAYPPSPDGKTLFPFRRLFIVAQAPGGKDA